jgi:hypothetical protein
MTRFSWMTTPSRPRWDGSRVIFEINDGNGRMISCAISRAALEAIGGSRCLRSADLLGCFIHARARIERLALEKLRGRPDGISGRLSLWADDVEFGPPVGVAVAVYQQIILHQSA